MYMILKHGYSSRPILHRIEEAILRYQKNRRIVTERREVFMKYLSYGGVNVSQKIFAGVDDREMQEMDSEQIMLFRGQTSIEEDRSEQPIDFDAVVKGYLYGFLHLAGISADREGPRTFRISSTLKRRR